MTLKNEHPRVLLQYRIIRVLAELVSVIPRTVLARIAVPLGRIWFAVDKRHRKVALANLRRAYGHEKSEQEILALARANFTALSRAALEIPSLLRLRKDNLCRYVTFTGYQNLKQAIAQGKGVLVLTAHLGNWELMALAVSMVFDTQIDGVARDLDYRPLHLLLNAIRSKTGNGVIDKQNGAPHIIRALRQKHMVGILLDQNASWYDGVYVPLFGQTACTNKGLAVFALRYNVPVVPVFNIHRDDGRYEILLSPPLELIRTGDLGRDILENTALFNRVIEAHIRKAPENWLWVHNRWREKKIPAHYLDKLPQVTLPVSEAPPLKAGPC